MQESFVFQSISHGYCIQVCRKLTLAKSTQLDLTFGEVTKQVRTNFSCKRMRLCSGNTSVVSRSIFMFSVNLQKNPRLPRTLFPNSLFTFFEKLCTGKFDSHENRCSVYIHQLGCMSIGFAFAVH